MGFSLAARPLYTMSYVLLLAVSVNYQLCDYRPLSSLSTTETSVGMAVPCLDTLTGK